MELKEIYTAIGRYEGINQIILLLQKNNVINFEDSTPRTEIRAFIRDYQEDVLDVRDEYYKAIGALSTLKRMEKDNAQ